MAHGSLGELYLIQGDLEHAILVFEQGLALCRASGNGTWLRGIAADLGSASALQGRLVEGRALLEEAISASLRTGGCVVPDWVAWLSEVCRLMGRGEEAWQHARQALDLARQQKERGNEALALHQLGTVHAHADPPDVAQAEAHYRQAQALAEELGMRPLQAHCHLGLGRCTTRLAVGSRPAPPWPPPSRCIAPWICPSGSPRPKPRWRKWGHDHEFEEFLAQRCARQGELFLPRCSASRLGVRRVSAYGCGLWLVHRQSDATRRRQMIRGEVIDGSTAVRRGIVSGNSAAAA